MKNKFRTRAASPLAALVAIVSLQIPQPSEAQEAEQSRVDNLLAEGDSLAQQREILIDDFLRWASQYSDLDKRGVSVPKSEGTSWLGFRPMLSELHRLRAVEAVKLAMDHTEVTFGRDRSGRERRPAAELLVSIGRPASARIIERLTSTQDSPREFLEIVRRIEGPATDILLRNAPKYVPTRESSQDKGDKTLEFRFMQIPAIRTPDYQGHDVKSVLDLSEGKIVEGPVVTKDDLGGSTEELLASVVQKVGRAGDLALMGGSLLVPSGRYARMDKGSFQVLDGKDLSHLVRKGDPILKVTKGEIILIETEEKKFGIVTFVGSNKDEGEFLLCYVFQPSGSATFEFSRLPSPVDIASGTPTLSDDQELAYVKFVYTRAAAFYEDYRRLTKNLHDVLDGRMPYVISKSQRAHALRLLGRLRHFESADLIIDNIGTKFPDVSDLTKHPAFEAMKEIWPVPRDALLKSIEGEEDGGKRKTLIDALNRVEGAAVAEVLLKKG